MLSDTDTLRQVRKALRDIRNTLIDPHVEHQKYMAIYQIDCLWALLQTEPERREPWSYYQLRIEEEFDE
jgi:hypothetical protein